MPSYKSSVSIEASQDVVWDYVADIRNLPAYVPGVTAAEPLPEHRARITLGSRTLEAEVARHESLRHRLEWSSTGYRGWLEVDKEGLVASVTAQLHTDEPLDEGDARLDQALFALKSSVESSSGS
jgi:uncharacterized membrane protein